MEVLEGLTYNFQKEEKLLEKDPKYEPVLWYFPRLRFLSMTGPCCSTTLTEDIEDDWIKIALEEAKEILSPPKSPEKGYKVEAPKHTTETPKHIMETPKRTTKTPKRRFEKPKDEITTKKPKILKQSYPVVLVSSGSPINHMMPYSTGNPQEDAYSRHMASELRCLSDQEYVEALKKIMDAVSMGLLNQHK